MLYISGVQFASCSQESSSCSGQQTDRCNCEVNNGHILQMLVEEAVEIKFQAVQREVNNHIDERIANSQHDLPGIVAIISIINSCLTMHWL